MFTFSVKKGNFPLFWCGTYSSHLDIIVWNPQEDPFLKLVDDVRLQPLIEIEKIIHGSHKDDVVAIKLKETFLVLPNQIFNIQNYRNMILLWVVWKTPNMFLIQDMFFMTLIRKQRSRPCSTRVSVLQLHIVLLVHLLQLLLGLSKTFVSALTVTMPSRSCLRL